MQHILFFAGEQLKAYALCKGEILHCNVFEPNDNGRIEFACYIDENISQPVRLLVDLIEEDFHLDSVPHVFGKDRKALQQRLLNKHLRGAEHRYIKRQGRQSGGRKDDQILIAGISNTDRLQPWLDILESRKVALAGIHSLALLAEGLIKTGSRQRGAQLLISQQIPGSVRHSLYVDGQLKMSRLAQVEDKAQDEIETTLRFIDHQRFLKSTQAPQLYYLSTDQQEYADKLFVQHLAQLRWPKNHYASLGNLDIYHHLIASRVLGAAALLIGLMALLGATYLFYLEHTQRQSIPALQASAQAYRQGYAQRIGATTPLQIEASDMQYSVQALHQLERQYSQQLPNFMHALSAASKNFPALSYRSIEWSVNEASELGTPVEPFIANIDAVLLEGLDSPRKAIQQVNQLILALREQAGFEQVSIIKMPFDIASNSQFKMDSRTAAERTTPVSFSLRIQGVLP